MNKFSKIFTSQIERGGSRAMLYALGLTKQECAVILGLIGDSQIQVKDIQFFYDLVYKIQEFIQEEQK